MQALFIVFCLAMLSIAGFGAYQKQEFTKDMIKFESRCVIKGGLTLQAYKAGKGWIGCYKDGKELENEQ